MRILLATLALLPALTAATYINGVPIPDDVMNLARQAVAGNSPRDALLRPDSVFRSHPMFQQLFNRLDFKKIDEEAAKMMVETLTKDEMAALVRFQNSPEGRGIIGKMPGYQQLVGGLVQNELKAAMEAYVLSQSRNGPQGAQSPGVGSVPTTPGQLSPYPGLPNSVPTGAPAMPSTPLPIKPASQAPATVAPALQGSGGSPVGR